MKFKMLYTFLFLISIVLIHFAVKNYNKTKALLNEGVKTRATVVDMIKSTSHSVGNETDGSSFTPVFEYVHYSGKQISFQSTISSNPPAYKIGEKVVLIYSKNGEDRKVVSFWGLYRWTIILLSVAAPFFIIGGGYLLYVNYFVV